MERRISMLIELSPYELATDFCDMGADDQALVFAFIKRISDKWEHSLSCQINAITLSDQFDDDAEKFMQLLGDYA